MNDTTPNIAAIVRQRLLSRSGAERVVMVAECSMLPELLHSPHFRQAFLRSKQSAGCASGFMATRLMSTLTSNTSFNQKLTEICVYHLPVHPCTNFFTHSCFD